MNLEALRAALRAALDQRSASQADLDTLLAAPSAENRSLTTEETDRFAALRTSLEALDVQSDELRQQISTLEDMEARRAAADALRSTLPADPAGRTVPPQVRVGAEPLTYQRGGNQSFFRDAIAATRNMDLDARDRLGRHAREVEAEAERRAANGQVEFRDLTRTDGTGGNWVPPIYLMDEAVRLARAARVTADLFTRRPLPGGTDSINIPAVLTGAAVAIQTADNGAVQETDMTDTNLSAPVRTIAGQQDVAVQLLEQSPMNVDEIIFADLLAAYATQIGLQSISGTGASGQITGLRSVSGIISVTYTDATPTVPELYSKLADAIQQIHANRFLPPTHIVMHPRRWGWFLAALDSQNRPLVVPNSSGPYNAVGNADMVDSQMIVGTLMGLPVVTDPNIPTNLGAGTNEDVIIVFRATDAYLWESSIRTRVLPDVGSGTLTTRLQVYGYVAAQAARYPKSIATVGGTGLVTPVF